MKIFIWKNFTLELCKLIRWSLTKQKRRIINQLSYQIRIIIFQMFVSKWQQKRLYDEIITQHTSEILTFFSQYVVKEHHLMNDKVRNLRRICLKVHSFHFFENFDKRFYILNLVNFRRKGEQKSFHFEYKVFDFRRLFRFFWHSMPCLYNVLNPSIDIVNLMQIGHWNYFLTMGLKLYHFFTWMVKGFVFNIFDLSLSNLA